MTVPAPTLTGRHVTLRPYVAGFLDEELARLRGWARDAEILALSGGVPIDLYFEWYGSERMPAAVRAALRELAR